MFPVQLEVVGSDTSTNGQSPPVSPSSGGWSSGGSLDSIGTKPVRKLNLAQNAGQKLSASSDGTSGGKRSGAQIGFEKRRREIDQLRAKARRRASISAQMDEYWRIEHGKLPQSARYGRRTSYFHESSTSNQQFTTNRTSAPHRTLCRRSSIPLKANAVSKKINKGPMRVPPADSPLLSPHDARHGLSPPGGSSTELSKRVARIIILRLEKLEESVGGLSTRVRRVEKQNGRLGGTKARSAENLLAKNSHVLKRKPHLPQNYPTTVAMQQTTLKEIQETMTSMQEQMKVMDNHITMLTHENKRLRDALEEIGSVQFTSIRSLSMQSAVNKEGQNKGATTTAPAFPSSSVSLVVPQPRDTRHLQGFPSSTFSSIPSPRSRNTAGRERSNSVPFQGAGGSSADGSVRMIIAGGGAPRVQTGKTDWKAILRDTDPTAKKATANNSDHIVGKDNSSTPGKLEKVWLGGTQSHTPGSQKSVEEKRRSRSRIFLMKPKSKKKEEKEAVDAKGKKTKKGKKSKKQKGTSNTKEGGEKRLSRDRLMKRQVSWSKVTEYEGPAGGSPSAAADGTGTGVGAEWPSKSAIWPAALRKSSAQSTDEDGRASSSGSGLLYVSVSGIPRKLNCRADGWVLPSSEKEKDDEKKMEQKRKSKDRISPQLKEELSHFMTTSSSRGEGELSNWLITSGGTREEHSVSTDPGSPKNIIREKPPQEVQQTLEEANIQEEHQEAEEQSGTGIAVLEGVVKKAEPDTAVQETQGAARDGGQVENQDKQKKKKYQKKHKKKKRKKRLKVKTSSPKSTKRGRSKSEAKKNAKKKKKKKKKKEKEKKKGGEENKNPQKTGGITRSSEDIATSSSTTEDYSGHVASQSTIFARRERQVGVSRSARDAGTSSAGSAVHYASSKNSGNDSESNGNVSPNRINRYNKKFARFAEAETDTTSGGVTNDADVIKHKQSIRQLLQEDDTSTSHLSSMEDGTESYSAEEHPSLYSTTTSSLSEEAYYPSSAALYSTEKDEDHQEKNQKKKKKKGKKGKGNRKRSLPFSPTGSLSGIFTSDRSPGRKLLGRGKKNTKNTPSKMGQAREKDKSKKTKKHEEKREAVPTVHRSQSSPDNVRNGFGLSMIMPRKQRHRKPAAVE